MSKFKKDLTPEEKAKPYSKYFYRKPVHPAPEKLAAMAVPIDPAKALPIEKINDLLDPGYHEVEAGWCVLPNGAGYIANLVPMPGVTVDMINWWFAWHGLEDLRYKLWSPEDHFAISMSEQDRKKVLDPRRTLTQKFQGLTHHVIEDVGDGPANITLSFLTPEDASFDMSRFKPPAVATLVAANITLTPIATEEEAHGPGMPIFMLHFIREIPRGIEYRSRFWMGYQVIDRKPQLLLPKGERVPEWAPRGGAQHNVHEYANLSAILPEIYKDQKGAIP